MQFSDGSLKHLTEHCTAILQQNQTKDTFQTQQAATLTTIQREREGQKLTHT